MTQDALATLRALIADPQRAAQMSPDEAAALMATLAAAQWALATRAQVQPVLPTSVTDPDRLLTPSETAERLGVSLRWLYRHARQLPFTRRLSRKLLRFSEAGLTRYLDGKKRA